MKRPQDNGLFSINGNKEPPEKGFFCLRLASFLTGDGITDWDRWHGAHMKSKAGECPCAERCDIHSFTKKHYTRSKTNKTNCKEKTSSYKK